MPSVDGLAEQTIQRKLTALETEHQVRILFAVESGSRAWGFPSPDSDYDVRFVYAHHPDWYLSLQPGRDVIELPLTELWDINGWDIRKALNLLMKPNPVMLEWLCSPIRYRWDDGACDRLRAFSERTAFTTTCLYHYRNLAQLQWDQHAGDTPSVNYKTYFYVLRPALMINWIRLNPDVLPPMNLQQLVAGLSLSDNMVQEIARLLDLKARASETGMGVRIPVIDAFIHDQLRWASEVPAAAKRPNLLAEGDALFRDLIRV